MTFDFGLLMQNILFLCIKHNKSSEKVHDLTYITYNQCLKKENVSLIFVAAENEKHEQKNEMLKERILLQRNLRLFLCLALVSEHV